MTKFLKPVELFNTQVDSMNIKYDTSAMEYGGNDSAVNAEIQRRIVDQTLGPGHEFREDQYVDPNSKSPVSVNEGNQML